MSKAIIAIASALAAAMLAGCAPAARPTVVSPAQAETVNPSVTATPALINEQSKTADIASPEQVVSSFFDAWNSGDIEAMNALTVNDVSKIEWSEGYDGVTLLECTPQEYTGEFPANGNAAYERSYVKTLFTIQANQGGSAGIESGTNDWGFWLVRETESSPWLILDWGY